MAVQGQRAAVLCSLGDNLIWTVPASTTETISISFASVDNTPVTMKIYHVRQGNGGARPHTDAHLLASPYVIEEQPVVLRDLFVSSLDDIVVHASVADKLVVNINSGG